MRTDEFNLRRRLTGTLLLAALVGLTGCRTTPPAPADRDTAPHALAGRSLALDSQALYRAERDAQLAAPDELVWYDYRNDLHPSVLAGYQGPTVEFSRTVTYDRQFIHNGRVDDHYHQTTIRSRVNAGVR